MGVVLVSVICFLFLSGAVYLHCILSFLALCVSGGSILALLSLWKGYFLIFVYVGGMLIMVVYFASLSSWVNFLKQVGWGVFLVSLLIFEVVKSGGWSSGSSSFFMNSYLEFVWSVLFLCLICVYASQLLWSGGALRSIF